MCNLCIHLPDEVSLLSLVFQILQLNSVLLIYVWIERDLNTNATIFIWGNYVSHDLVKVKTIRIMQIEMYVIVI